MFAQCVRFDDGEVVEGWVVCHTRSAFASECLTVIAHWELWGGVEGGRGFMRICARRCLVRVVLCSCGGFLLDCGIATGGRWPEVVSFLSFLHVAWTDVFYSSRHRRLRCVGRIRAWGGVQYIDALTPSAVVDVR